MPECEQEQTKLLEAWGGWYADLGEDVVDPGNPFFPVVQHNVSDCGGSGGPERSIWCFSLESPLNLTLLVLAQMIYLRPVATLRRTSRITRFGNMPSF